MTMVRTSSCDMPSIMASAHWDLFFARISMTPIPAMVGTQNAIGIACPVAVRMMIPMIMTMNPETTPHHPP